MEMFATLDMKTNNISNATTIAGTNVNSTNARSGNFQGPTNIVTTNAGQLTLVAGDWGSLQLFNSYGNFINLPVGNTLTPGWNVTLVNKLTNTASVRIGNVSDFINANQQYFTIPPGASITVTYVATNLFTLSYAIGSTFSSTPVAIDFTQLGNPPYILNDPFLLSGSRFILTSVNIVLTNVAGIALGFVVSVGLGVSATNVANTFAIASPVQDACYTIPLLNPSPVAPVATTTIYNMAVTGINVGTTCDGYAFFNGYIASNLA